MPRIKRSLTVVPANLHKPVPLGRHDRCLDEQGRRLAESFDDPGEYPVIALRWRYEDDAVPRPAEELPRHRVVRLEVVADLRGVADGCCPIIVTTGREHGGLPPDLGDIGDANEP